MTKSYCDRCGNEMKAPMDARIVFYKRDAITQDAQFELCHACALSVEGQLAALKAQMRGVAVAK